MAAGKNLQIKRGIASSLVTLAAGELGWTTDTKVLYVGDGAANKAVLMASQATAAGLALIDDASATAQLVTLGALPRTGGTMTGSLKAPLFNSVTATITGVPDITPTTIYTFANAAPAYWIVSADLGSQNDATNWGSMAWVHSDGATASIAQALVAGGGNEVLSLSGLNLQIVQKAGAAQTVHLTLTRVA